VRLALTDAGEYTLALSVADRVFLVSSLIMSQTHTGDAEYEIVTGRSKDAGDAYLQGWRLTGSEGDGYALDLSQPDLDFVFRSLRLCVTHVSDAEYEIVIGRRRQESAAELSDLEDQAEAAFSERIKQEVDRKGGWQLVVARMGDLSLLAEEVLVDRLATEASEQGKAIDAGERQRALVLQSKIDAVLAELERRGADASAVLAGLLGSDDPGVRLLAASKLLRSNPAARLTLETLAKPGRPGLARAAERALRSRRRRER